MSKLIILRGNSGSGKSSVAQMLQKEFGHNTLLIPQDTVRRDMLHASDKPGTPALHLLIDLLQYGRKHCDIVILEGILRTDSYMPLFEAAIAEFGQDIYAYYYDLPFEETLVRHSTRRQSAEFGEVQMRSWWRELDLIGIIPEVILTKETSLQDTVNMIRSSISK